ncbi:MAG: Na/Pi symporter [Sulfuricurvum sp.]
MFDLVGALAGLGLFLFGMISIESGIKSVAGSHFKSWLRSSTNSDVRAISTGAIVTAILQSSTLVSLMVLAFVGANILTLRSAIGIIFGANIGSTGVSWIITLFGFSSGVSDIALLLMAISGVGVLFSTQRRKLLAFFSMLMGFALLFYGLDMMKNSIEDASKLVDLEALKSYGFVAYIGVGVVLTLIIRSSAASMAIFLSAIEAGAIDFYAASMLSIGASIGTTGTILIGAIGANAIKKRVALSHLLFNLFSSLLILALYVPISSLILAYFWDNPSFALTLFYTTHSLLGVLVFTPFIPRLESFLLTRFKSSEMRSTRYIDSVDPALPEAALEALRSEALGFYREVMRFSLLLFNIPPKEIFSLDKKSRSVVYRSQNIIDIDVEAHYERLKKLELDMLIYASRISQRSDDDELHLASTLRAIKELRYTAKIIKDIKHNLDEFASSSDSYTLHFYNESRVRVAKLFKYLLITLSEDAYDKEELSQKLSTLLENIEQEDQNALQIITKAIANEEISRYDSPLFITINRTVVNASKALLEAVRAVRKTEEV